METMIVDRLRKSSARNAIAVSCDGTRVWIDQSDPSATHRQPHDRYDQIEVSPHDLQPLIARLQEIATEIDGETIRTSASVRTT
jgi:hypothetical protein